MTRPVTQQFRQNLVGFWSAYFWLFVLFAVAVFADCSSTIYFMLRDGYHSEIHPMFRLAAAHFGPVVGPVVAACAKIALAIIICIYLRKFTPAILLAATIISVCAATYNLGGLDTTYIIRLLASLTGPS